MLIFHLGIAENLKIGIPISGAGGRRQQEISKLKLSQVVAVSATVNFSDD